LARAAARCPVGGAATAVPLRDMGGGEVPVVSTPSDSSAVREPAAVGLKVTVKVQLAVIPCIGPLGRTFPDGQLLLWAKSPGLAPVKVGIATNIPWVAQRGGLNPGTLQITVTVTVPGTPLVVPTVCAGNVRLVGEAKVLALAAAGARARIAAAAITSPAARKVRFKIFLPGCLPSIGADPFTPAGKASQFFFFFFLHFFLAAAALRCLLFFLHFLAAV
jgi:hypothetical protein